MKAIRREVDQFVMLGQDIALGPTDIDDKGVRLVANGRMLGGPEDGGAFTHTHDLQVGQTFNVGPLIQVTIARRAGNGVELHIFHPPGIEVLAKEEFDQRVR